MIKLKRIYDEPSEDDGCRVLVDRIWPRGVAKKDAELDEWCKAVAPSNDLRKWYHEDVDGRWRQFRRKYVEELKNARDELDRLARLADGDGLTLLTATRDRDRNHTVVLKNVLEREG